jgi:hypothetical protein
MKLCTDESIVQYEETWDGVMHSMIDLFPDETFEHGHTAEQLAVAIAFQHLNALEQQIRNYEIVHGGSY